MLLLAVLITLAVPIFCAALGVRRQVLIAIWFFVVAQFVGIYPRALATNNGWDWFIGPWESDWIPRALGMLILYNVCFLIGILFGHIAVSSAKKHQDISGTSDGRRKTRFVGPKAMLTSLLISSLPGVLLLLGHHNTVLNDQNIAVDRTNTQGLGPQIVLQEIPYAASAVWYSFKNGKVRLGWWISLVVLLVLSLMSGSRSQTLDFIMVLVALRFIQTNSKLRKRTVAFLSILGVILMYVGWIIVYARGMMRTEGGSFFLWASQAAKMNPLQAYNQLLHHSFNGYDGLVSVVGTVPTLFPYHVGQLWYQCATILIPRALWTTKWTTDIAGQFTQAVWGWAGGGNFVTGVGAMYLDSGWVGVMFGSLFLGVVTSLLCRAKVTPESNHWFAKIVVAVWCFFLARFTFAGGSMDAAIAGRMIVEVCVILIIVKAIATMFVVRPINKRPVTYNKLGIIDTSGSQEHLKM